MGVNNFANFFKPVFANSENERYIREYRGKIVVIDAIQRMTKQCIGRRSKGYEHVGSNGKSNTHIVALFNTVVGLLDFGIHPIFVFDGKLSCAYRGRFDETRPNMGEATGKDLGQALDQLLLGKTPSAEQIPSIGCNIKWK